jgi:proteasome alpha subunit
MAYTPYDWQQTLRQKADYVEDRLRGGSPAVGLSCEPGILLLTTRRTQRKIFEVYDRLAFTGLGNPSDLETVRQLSVDFAHAEGYQRSPDDVSIQRVVGMALSPVLKRSFADPFRTPLVLRGLFVQVAERPEEDLFYHLNYDGEYLLHPRQAVIAGTEYAERQMEQAFAGREARRRSKSAARLSLDAALERAVQTWAVGRWSLQTGIRSPQEEGARESIPDVSPSARELQEVWSEELHEGTVEAAVLQRDPTRDRRLKFLTEDELARFLPSVQGDLYDS